MPDFAVIILLILLVVGYVIIRAARNVSTATKKLESRKANTVSARMRVVVDGKEVQSVDLGKITLKGKASDDWIELDSINFSGRIACRSANGEYAVASGDSSAGGDGKTKGAVVLFSGDGIVYHKRFERPNDVKVGDNGNVIVNDWLRGRDTEGMFCALDPDGRTIIKQLFKANLNGNAISTSGRYALCSTCASEHEPHDSVTFLFDLQSGEVVTIIEYATYENRIDEEARLLHMDESEIHLIFNFEGECVQGYGPSNPTWYAHCRGYDLYEAYAAELAEVEPGFTTFEEYQPYIEHFQEAITRIASENWKAKIYLQIGDIYAKFKMVDEARESYHAATRENPKAAVTRRLQRLDKM